MFIYFWWELISKSTIQKTNNWNIEKFFSTDQKEYCAHAPEEEILRSPKKYFARLEKKTWNNDI